MKSSKRTDLTELCGQLHMVMRSLIWKSFHVFVFSNRVDKCSNKDEENRERNR